MTVVFCSSKTGAEIARLCDELQLAYPFIAENGGGIFLPEGRFDCAHLGGRLMGKWRIIPLGVPYDRLVEALREVRSELALPLRGFSDMGAEEVARRSGFDIGAALLAKERHFDEPFVAECEDAGALERMNEAFRARGLRIIRGGRFFHLTGGNDKGLAVRRLNGLFLEKHRAIHTVGLGDSANDLAMLAEVDEAFLVKKPDGTYDEFVRARLPRVACVDATGPEGWAVAVAEAIKKKTGCRGS